MPEFTSTHQPRKLVKQELKERREKVYQYRTQYGMSFDQIGKALGTDRETARLDYTAFCKAFKSQYASDYDPTQDLHQRLEHFRAIEQASFRQYQRIVEQVSAASKIEYDVNGNVIGKPDRHAVAKLELAATRAHKMALDAGTQFVMLLQDLGLVDRNLGTIKTETAKDIKSALDEIDKLLRDKDRGSLQPLQALDSDENLSPAERAANQRIM